MKAFIKYLVSAFLIITVQVLILNRLSIGHGVYLMLPPLFILILPFRMKLHHILILSFAFGLILDTFMNSYGLHASSLVMIAYLRPILFRFFSPSDEYTRGENTVQYASTSKFVLILFFTLLIHHIWYFSLESFNIDGFLTTVLRIALSVFASFILCYFTFLIFYRERHVIK